MSYYFLSFHNYLFLSFLLNIILSAIKHNVRKMTLPTFFTSTSEKANTSDTIAEITPIIPKKRLTIFLFILNPPYLLLCLPILYYHKKE